MFLECACTNLRIRSPCRQHQLRHTALGIIYRSLILTLFLCSSQSLSLAGIVCAKPIGLLLVILWSAGLGSNTSTNGPFQSPCHNANGFFASWICWGASLQYCYNSVFGPIPGRSSRFEYDEEEDRLQDGDKSVLLGSRSAYGAIGERAPLHG